MLRIHAVGRWVTRTGAAVAALLFGQGCDSGLLEVTDPDIILDANSRAGAQALRNGVFLRLSQAVNGIQGPDALFVFSGLITDEWRSGDTFVQRNNQDQRVWQPENTFNAAPYRGLNRIRVEGKKAIQALRTYLPDSLGAVGSMLALSAYSEVLIGEMYCNGTPLSDIEGPTIIYGMPLTNDSVLGLAIATADSALFETGREITRDDALIAQADSGLATPTPADTARWRLQRNDAVRARTGAIRHRDLAAVVKGRALLARGQFAAAAAAVAAVPTGFRFHAAHSLTSTTNQIWALNVSARRYTMTAGQEGGVGIDFFTPNDPRLPRRQSTTPIFDTSVPLNAVFQGLYGQFDSVPIATGIEARLIEAELNLQGAGDRAAWLTAINTLRTTVGLYPTATNSTTRGPNLTNLTDPGTDSARVATHFRERAFWMFSTGHRLGDMRRQIRQYAALGFNESDIYPNGSFIKGGVYGDAIQMPVPFVEENNPNFTGCIDRNP